jgi:hypothetical protein
MTINKNALPTEGTPKTLTSLLAFGANTLTSAYAYKHGSVTVIEFGLSNATTSFLKVSSNGALEVGGTLEMGTGTKVTW